MFTGIIEEGLCLIDVVPHPCVPWRRETRFFSQWGRHSCLPLLDSAAEVH